MIQFSVVPRSTAYGKYYEVEMLMDGKIAMESRRWYVHFGWASRHAKKLSRATLGHAYGIVDYDGKVIL